MFFSKTKTGSPKRGNETTSAMNIKDRPKDCRHDFVAGTSRVSDFFKGRYCVYLDIISVWIWEEGLVLGFGLVDISCLRGGVRARKPLGPPDQDPKHRKCGHVSRL